jgi:glycosyltransferase involved in cell wall biosynthesis
VPSLTGSITQPPDRPVRVFFPCTGLGRQRRGFETFTLECAAALRLDARLAITVFAGEQITEVPATVVANLARDSRGAAWLGRLTGRGPYFVEQLTFFLSFLPHLVRGRPDVVYFADLNLGNLCWHWRRVSGQRYQLLFYNGGLTTKPFTRADIVQQLTPAGLSEATARGEDPARQIVMPHGVRVPAELPARIVGVDRLALGLPADRPVVLSVGLLDATIKRMDYLIREVAALPTPRPFLILLGAEDDETPAIREMAGEMLGSENVALRTVSSDEISAYYRAADVFVLASLREGFGLAYVEALAHGLPIVAHDFAGTRYLLGKHAWLSDLTQPDAASHALAAALATSLTDEERRERHASAHDRFGWDVLREQYAAMLLRAAQA